MKRQNEKVKGASVERREVKILSMEALRQSIQQG